MLLPAELSRAERQLRLITLLDGSERIGLSPLPVEQLHTIAYFADALAPVWNIPIIDGQILKRHRPYYPALQDDLDNLAGIGVVIPSNVRHEESAGGWRINADYRLNSEFAPRIIAAAEQFPRQAQELAFVREIVYATSGLGISGIAGAAHVDATYGDPLVDVGGMIEVRPDEGDNATADVAFRFRELLSEESKVSSAEMVNLYVRRLYSRLQVA